MKHNLNTILKILNDWLNKDAATGLTPMTPMHMEINRMKEELRDRCPVTRSGPILETTITIKELLDE